MISAFRSLRMVCNYCIFYLNFVIATVVFSPPHTYLTMYITLSLVELELPSEGYNFLRNGIARWEINLYDSTTSSIRYGSLEISYSVSRLVLGPKSAKIKG